MKAIGNISELNSVLNVEEPNWKEKVYDDTGTLLLLDQGYGTLLSNCGYIDLDSDAEYVYLNGRDETEYVSIKSYKELSDYILNMESYQKVLRDESFGMFSKAELFWAVQYQIVLAKGNQEREDGTVHQDWALNRVYADNTSCSFYNNNEKKNGDTIVLDMALVDYDDTEIWIPKKDNLDLDSALETVVEQMNELTKNNNDIPQYRIFKDNAIIIPKTYEELKEVIKHNGILRWLL